MIARSYIMANLRMLERSYLQSRSTKKSLFYAKLAILELCGWVEESMDDVVLRCAKKHLKDKANKKFVQDQIVDRTFGFDYKKHFRQMLIQLVGLVNVERLEKRVDQTKRAGLETTLANLKSIRNSEAHTHIKGVTRKINAPSVTIDQFLPVYDGLVEYDTAIRNMRF